MCFKCEKTNEILSEAIANHRETLDAVILSIYNDYKEGMIEEDFDPQVASFDLDDRKDSFMLAPYIVGYICGELLSLGADPFGLDRIFHAGAIHGRDEIEAQKIMKPFFAE